MQGFFFLVEQDLNRLIQIPSPAKVAFFDKLMNMRAMKRYRNVSSFHTFIGKQPMLEELYLKRYNEHMLDLLGLGSQNIMTTTNEHLLVKHGVHKTYMNAEDCYSLEPSPALHGQSSLSQPWLRCWSDIYNIDSLTRGSGFNIMRATLE